MPSPIVVGPDGFPIVSTPLPAGYVAKALARREIVPTDRPDVFALVAHEVNTIVPRGAARFMS